MTEPAPIIVWFRQDLRTADNPALAAAAAAGPALPVYVLDDATPGASAQAIRGRSSSMARHAPGRSPPSPASRRRPARHRTKTSGVARATRKILCLILALRRGRSRINVRFSPGAHAPPGRGARAARVYGCFEEARLIARSRPRLAIALSVSAALLVAGCYSKISEEDGGTLPASEAKKPAMTPLEREQAAALDEQKKRVASLAETHPGGGSDQTKVASADLKAEPKKAATADHEKATTVATIAPGAGGYWVQIGSGRDETDSEALWNRSKAAHPTILGDASHAIVRADLGPGKGVFYRVHVGPYENASAAGTLCGRLRAAHVDCFLVAPGGAMIPGSETSRVSVEPAKPVDTAPGKPATGAGKDKPAGTATTTTTTAKPAASKKPAATAAKAKPARKAKAAD